MSEKFKNKTATKQPKYLKSKTVNNKFKNRQFCMGDSVEINKQIL